MVLGAGIAVAAAAAAGARRLQRLAGRTAGAAAPGAPGRAIGCVLDVGGIRDLQSGMAMPPRPRGEQAGWWDAGCPVSSAGAALGQNPQLHMARGNLLHLAAGMAVSEDPGSASRVAAAGPAKPGRRRCEWSEGTAPGGSRAWNSCGLFLNHCRIGCSADGLRNPGPGD